MLFNKTLIIGLGLIGGSLAKALKQDQISKEIIAQDINLDSLKSAQEQGVIDGSISLNGDLKNFDLVIIATPISTYEEIFKNISKKISKEALVIDLGSIKNLKVKNLPENFIPCHPIAGSETGGFDNSCADLFANKKFLFCKRKNSEKIVKLIEKINAKPEFIEAKSHDKIYALISHLPQFLSFVSTEFSPKDQNNEFIKTCFRLDNSNPEIWGDIFNNNAENIEDFYVEFFDNLEANFKLKADEILQKLYELTKNTKAVELDQNYLEINFAKIFFRILIILSYLEISAIKNYQKYAGTGFEDFTKIIEIIPSLEKKNLLELIEKNNSKITKFFNSLN